MKKKMFLREEASAVVAQAIRLGLNNPAVNEFSALLVEKLSGPDSYIDVSDIAHLKRLIATKIAMSQERIDPVEPFRPQPTQDELGHGDFILPFSVLETNAKFSPSYEHLIRGAQAMSAVGFGKTTVMKHILAALMKSGVSVIVFDSKGTHEFDSLQ